MYFNPPSIIVYSIDILKSLLFATLIKLVLNNYWFSQLAHIMLFVVLKYLSVHYDLGYHWTDWLLQLEKPCIALQLGLDYSISNFVNYFLLLLFVFSFFFIHGKLSLIHFYYYIRVIHYELLIPTNRLVGPKAVDPNYCIQPTLWLSDFCLRVLTLLGIELRLFFLGTRHSPYLYY